MLNKSIGMVASGFVLGLSVIHVQYFSRDGVDTLLGKPHGQKD
jgi:hypothetical protein